MELLYNQRYRDLMSQQTKAQIMFLLQNSYEFSIVVNMDEGVDFNPELPEEITSAFRDFTVFAIAGYTFKSAFVKDNELIFEAGFGSENIGAMVYVDIDRIVQILIGETPIFINPTATTPKQKQKDSFDVFSKNPKNSKFFKK